MSYQIAKPVSEKPVGLTGSEINDYILMIIYLKLRKIQVILGYK